jgi:phosphohistidine swiveling domain-containing protein
MGKLIGRGYNVIRNESPSRGVVRYVKSPQDVVNLLREKSLAETIVLTRGGTVTFVGPVLSKKPAGIITIEGAPQSHLGILAREFRVPTLMSVELADSPVPRLSPQGVTSEEYVEYVIKTLNGRRVQIDCSDPGAALLYEAD